MKFIHYLTFRVEGSNGICNVKQVTLESDNNILTNQQFDYAKQAAIHFCNLDSDKNAVASIIDSVCINDSNIS